MADCSTTQTPLPAPALTVAQVATALACDRQTVTKLITSGKLPAADLSPGGKNRTWRVSPDAVAAMLGTSWTVGKPVGGSEVAEIKQGNVDKPGGKAVGVPERKRWSTLTKSWY